MKINVVEEFFALASSNSPSRREAPVAAYLINRLREMGLNGSGSFGPPEWERHGQHRCPRAGQRRRTHHPALRSYGHRGPDGGDGSCPAGWLHYSNGETVLGADDKAGSQSSWRVVRTPCRRRPPRSDRGGLQRPGGGGALRRKLSDRDIKAAFGYILDGDGPVGNIINQAPSKVDLDFVLEGKAAHAGISPEKGINAIVAAAKAIARLRTGRIDAQPPRTSGSSAGGRPVTSFPTGQKWPSRSGAPIRPNWRGRFRPSWMPSTPRRRPPARVWPSEGRNPIRPSPSTKRIRWWPTLTARPVRWARAPAVDIRRRHGRQRLQRPGTYLRGTRDR